MLLQAISTENGVFPFFGFPPFLPYINLKYIADFHLKPNTRAKTELRNDLKIERKAKNNKNNEMKLNEKGRNRGT